MKVSLADKLKELRKTKNVSQEKFAEYLGVSFQAVSKWENGVTSPDILLLPDIARYYGITVDELLQVEQIDADRYLTECCLKAEELKRNGKINETIPIVLEAYKKFPNDIWAKELLMSSYFDTDKVKYQNEIIELGTEIYNTNCESSYKSFFRAQAIAEIARTYYANGNVEKAHEWAVKAAPMNNCQEFLYMQVLDEEDKLAGVFSFCNRFYLKNLFYTTARLNMCNVKCFGEDYVQRVNKAVVNIFEIAYPNDDMSYESLEQLCTLHRCIAEDETFLGKDEAVIRKHLSRAVECAVKSTTVKAHELTHPLVYGSKVEDAPSDNKQLVRNLKAELMWQCFDQYRSEKWFIELVSYLHE